MKPSTLATFGLAAPLLLTGCIRCVKPDVADEPAPPAARFAAAVFLEAAENTANASLGDLDGDDDTDLVLAKGRHWPLPGLVDDGHGGFTQRHPLGRGSDRSYTAALADLDGDARADVIVANRGGPDYLSDRPTPRDPG